MPLGLHHAAQGRAGDPRGDESRRRARDRTCRTSLPAELWQETGRWDKFGPQLLRMQGPARARLPVRPTHEEVVTDIVRKDIRSYRQLPMNLYQIQAKFRDEIRPRFGVMRGARVPDEGRLLVRRRPRRVDALATARCTTPTRASSRGSDCKFRAVRRRHRRDRRLRVARVPGARRLGRGRDRVQRRLRLRGERRAGRSARARECARPAPAEPMQKVPTPGQATCEDVAELLGLPLATDGQVPAGARATIACRCCSSAAITWATR